MAKRWTPTQKVALMRDQLLTWPGLMMVLSFAVCVYVAVQKGDLPAGLWTWSLAQAGIFNGRWITTLWAPGANPAPAPK